MRRRVVITGMGAITPLGQSVADLFAGVVEGRSAVGPITRFDAATLPTPFASEVKGFDLARHLSTADRYVRCGVNTQFALAATRQALEDANLLAGGGLDRDRFGVYLGSGEGSEDFLSLISSIGRATDEPAYKVNAPRFVAGMMANIDPGLEAELEMHTTGGHMAVEFDLGGPNVSCQTACAAGSQAVGEAVEMIRFGEADIMVAGGSHSMIHPLGVTGFNLLTALSTRAESPTTASRPFDLTRDGFVLGEGAGIVILEELEHAKRRKAPIYAELSGYGTTADAYRMTDPHPGGRGAIRCIADALKDADVSAADIGYINAHGTSTQANDATETAAIKGVFGEGAYKVPVSSSKSMLGHLIAAAGVVELIISVMAMRKGVLPPTINYETPDPVCDLDYIPNAAREAKVRHVLSNSFGFGGQNAALVASAF